jgi:hypothetical protein
MASDDETRVVECLKMLGPNIDDDDKKIVSSVVGLTLEAVSGIWDAHIKKNQSRKRRRSTDESGVQTRRYTRRTPTQVKALQELFEATDGKPTKQQRQDMAERLGLSFKTVSGWFAQRRCTVNKNNATTRGYNKFSDDQEQILIALFNSTDGRPSRPEKQAIANYFGLEYKKINNWILSRREWAKRRGLYKTKPAHKKIPEYESRVLQSFYKATGAIPTKEQQQAIADQLGLDLGLVYRWFNNQRSYRRKKGEDVPTHPFYRTPEQLAALQQLYDETEGYPSTEQKYEIADHLNLKYTTICKWYERKRYTNKKQKTMV